MPEFTLSYSKQAAQFLKDLPPKQCKQLAIKTLDLQRNPYPPDSQPLKGQESLRRADQGEYRIIYEVVASVVSIVIIDRKNDVEVYKHLKRKIG